MDALSAEQIRASFVNCSKGEAGRLALPRDLAEQPWEELDFLGWRDPGAPDRRYLVAPYRGAGDAGERLVGVTLRAPTNVRRTITRTNICAICATAHGGDGVALLVARRAGDRGRDGNTVGTYLCTDLACSLYLRGRKQVKFGRQINEDLPVEARIERARDQLAAFLDQVLATAPAA